MGINRHAAMAQAIAIGDAADLNGDFLPVNNAVPDGGSGSPLADNGAFTAFSGMENLNKAFGFMDHFNIIPMLAQPDAALS